MKLKRILLCALTFSMLALLFVPEAEARRRGSRGRHGRGRRGRSSRNTSISNQPAQGHDFFGKRRTVKGFEGISIQSADRPGPAQYVFNSNYLNVLRESLNEALGK